MANAVKSEWLGWFGDAGIVAAATGAAFLAHHNERPITAVLIHLIGVLLVSARSGQFRGVLAALFSFLAYLFLAQPAFALSRPTGDTVVPLFAFLFFATAASAVVGRLRDNAAAAVSAERKSAFLLAIGDCMQRVLRVEDVEEEVAKLLPSGGLTKLKLYVADGSNLVRPSRGNSLVAELTGPAREEARRTPGKRQVFLELPGAAEPVGVIELILDGNELADADLRPIAALLALTVERCLLLERINEVQAAERTEVLKDAILSSVSHDLRTPLTAIDAAASTLLSPQLRIPAKERETLLAAIVEQCARLNRYTGDLLDMGRISAGISSEAFETVELGEILAVALQQVRETFPAIRLEKTLNARPVLVSANAPMLQQALYNLIENAAKHGGDGEVVQVALEQADGRALVTVEDNGPGIPPGEHHRIFERFYRVGGAGDKGGSGLGLYIAKGFLDAFGARIEVDSPRADGRGTRMTVSLPAMDSIAPTELEQAE